MTTTLLSREAVEKGVTGLIGTENSPYNAGWNDAIRHVLMDLKTGAYSDHSPPGSGVLPDCEKLAQWMLSHGFSTGHGDAVDDLLLELGWQVKELRADTRNTGGGCEKIKAAFRKIVFAARTSGGTAGPDPELMVACESAEALLNAG